MLSPPLAVLGVVGPQRGLDEMDVGLFDRLAVDEDLLVPYLDRLAGQADDALDEVALRLVGVLEDDDVPPLDRPLAEEGVLPWGAYRGASRPAC